MIIWTGWGILAAIIPFFILLFTEKFVESVWADSFYYQLHGWPKFIGFLVSAGVIYILSKYLKQRDNPRVLIDKKTGKELVYQRKHTLFFIDLMYWPYILIGLGVIFSFVNNP